MTLFKISISRTFQKAALMNKKLNRGAITVEYALGMAVAAFLMIGVELMFRRMAIDILSFFEQLVTQFPNI